MRISQMSPNPLIFCTRGFSAMGNTMVILFFNKNFLSFLTADKPYPSRYCPLFIRMNKGRSPFLNTRNTKRIVFYELIYMLITTSMHSNEYDLCNFYVTQFLISLGRRGYSATSMSKDIKIALFS